MPSTCWKELFQRLTNLISKTNYMSNTDSPIASYFKALNRICANKPAIVPKGSTITNDLVSVEAGKTKGSIKKSRPAFAALIKEIAEAAAKQKKELNPNDELISKLRDQLADVKQELNDALGREASLVYEIYRLRENLSKLTGENILPLLATRIKKSKGSNQG